MSEQSRSGPMHPSQALETKGDGNDRLVTCTPPISQGPRRQVCVVPLTISILIGHRRPGNIFSKKGRWSEDEENITEEGVTTSSTEITILVGKDSEENGVDRIVTFCQSIDDMLDGGFPLQSLTELCGAPGSGKTQLCLQLCAAVQIPRACGGLEGQALYIDTRNGFTACRLRVSGVWSYEAAVQEVHDTLFDTLFESSKLCVNYKGLHSALCPVCSK
uniref:DNA repair protein RAD51 homolog 3 n=1 Tax=Timema cristinae TaxID=61476 RepID=A0A7R9CZ83_TIMCR|nr:unnamed protein product [Timema cristinae]